MGKKPGWKTTEFWLSLLAMVLGVVVASGVFEDGGVVLQVAGIGMAILGKLGYTVPRAKGKAVEAVAELGPN
jgi:preprotein translocase subunit Sss1